MRHVPAQGRRRGAQGATCLARFRRVHICVCMRYRLQMLAFVAQHGFWHIFLSHTRHIARQESATLYENFIVAARSLSPAPCIGLLHTTLQAEEQTRLGRLWLLQVSQVFFFSLFSTLSTGVIVLRAIIRALRVFKCKYVLGCMGVNSGVIVWWLLCVAFLMVALNLPVFTPKLLRCACPSCLRLCITLAVFSQNEEANTEGGAGGVSSHELDNPRVEGVCAGV